MPRKKKMTNEELAAITWEQFKEPTGVEDCMKFWEPLYKEAEFDLIRLNIVHSTCNTCLVRMAQDRRGDTLLGIARIEFEEKRKLALVRIDDWNRKYNKTALDAFHELYSVKTSEMRLAYLEAFNNILAPLQQIANELRTVITHNKEVLKLAPEAQRLKSRGVAPIQDFTSPFGKYESGQHNERDAFEALFKVVIARAIEAGLSTPQGLNVEVFNTGKRKTDTQEAAVREAIRKGMGMP